MPTLTRGYRKERRQFREALATWKNVRYASFRQSMPPASYMLEPLMPWFAPILLSFSNLRALNLNGAWSFHDAPFIHQAILRSRVSLRVLGIYRPAWPRIYSGPGANAVGTPERCSLFWARLIELLTDTVRAEHEERWGPQPEKAIERAVGTPLRLHHLAVNADVEADFAALTDFTALRHLVLIHGGGGASAWGPQPVVRPFAADSFHSATNLEVIESSSLDDPVRNLLAAVHAAGNKKVKHRVVSGDQRLFWPSPAPWATDQMWG